MIQKTVTVNSEHGLHARPAALIVKAATKFRSEFYIERDGMKVNGKSIMGVMMLAAENGAVLTLSAQGVDAEYLIEEVSSLIEGGFGA
ncbi:MAG TPA: HPr family phosphocarrier protein [Candidatus Cloacimonetes bacterium]|jgi:phosphocarrier protein HPr|nr:HPr family phosphocarrier protein [Candidatus Cloacimonas sp.]HHZ15353.1 HPr family phosphocarrier protein [Candidatus Cloacimonadota bacterium]